MFYLSENFGSVSGNNERLHVVNERLHVRTCNVLFKTSY